MMPLLLATTPAPDPVELEIWEVSPGIEGFLWGFLLLAVLAIPLFLSLVKHMRRVDHNARVRQRAEEAAAAEAASAAQVEGDVRVVDAESSIDLRPVMPAGPSDGDRDGADGDESPRTQA